VRLWAGGSDPRCDDRSTERFVAAQAAANRGRYRQPPDPLQPPIDVFSEGSPGANLQRAPKHRRMPVIMPAFERAFFQQPVPVCL
jgi:hypothetical protein